MERLPACANANRGHWPGQTGSSMIVENVVGWSIEVAWVWERGRTMSRLLATIQEGEVKRLQTELLQT